LGRVPTTADDGLCTEDQVRAGLKVSVNSYSPRQYLGTYEDAYAEYGFMSCETDDCNQADACTGAPPTDFKTDHADDGMSIGHGIDHGPDYCWVTYSPGEPGSSLSVHGLGNDASQATVCLSYCLDCAMEGVGETFGDTCTSDQIADGVKLSMHTFVFADALQYYAGRLANYGFMSCHTDNCNQADACVGSSGDGVLDSGTQVGLDGGSSEPILAGSVPNASPTNDPLGDAQEEVPSEPILASGVPNASPTNDPLGDVQEEVPSEPKVTAVPTKAPTVANVPESTAPPTRAPVVTPATLATTVNPTVDDEVVLNNGAAPVGTIIATVIFVTAIFV